MIEEDIRKRSVFNTYLELVQQDSKIFFPDESKFIFIECPGCASLEHKKQFKKWGFNYVLCCNCKTLFVNPRPRFDSLLSFYKESPSTNFWVNDFFKPIAEIRRDKIFKKRAEYINTIFPELQNSIIGDIGAGFGLFLEELAKIWPSAKLIAIEPSIEMAEICKSKRLSVIPDALENVRGCDNRFDLLACFELSEHIHSPSSFLKKIWELLKPGGYLYLTTLNGEGFDIQVLWENSKSIAPPHHLNFFNVRSIEILLRKNGFEVVNVDTPGELDWDIVEGMFLKEGIDIGRFWSLLVDKDTAIKQRLQDWIAKSKLSSHMRVVAKKNI
ncbi:MAG TPA: SAM-dependent methyltransferase [Desulfotomaculum sp.]|nr:MAG: Methyltransferase type 12 [Desulfotomaculum sp. 46_296]HAG10150.1 SAM-dependent methyltransferase [Desulfotomaculum sp.]HBY03659.1 SAM-dependent methyltransferase [Desulfotomaculum sp.]